jgi:hypothetical protein
MPTLARYLLLAAILVTSLANVAAAAQYPIPGEVRIQLVQATPAQTATGLLRAYGLSAAGSSTSGQADDRLLVAVPRGQEGFWRDVLAQHPAVQKADLRHYSVPDSKGYEERGVRLPVTHLAAVDSLDALLDEALAFFEAEAAETPGGGVELLVKAPQRLHLRLQGLRGRVIGHRNYWESVSITTVLLPHADGLKLLMITEGGFAPGLGDRPPAASAYLPIDKQALGDYAKGLITRLQLQLEQP